jgi:hypothetical protein
MRYELTEYEQDPQYAFKNHDDVQILQDDYKLRVSYFTVAPDMWRLFLECDIRIPQYSDHTNTRTLINEDFYDFESMEHRYSYVINLLTTIRKRL